MEIYKEILDNKNPQLYNLLVEVNQNSNLVEVASDGNLTLKLTTMDGKQIYAHSKYKPVESSIKQVEKVNIDFHAPVIICFGLGMGYEIEEIIKRKAPVSKVIIVEPDLTLLKTVLISRDMTELLSMKSVYIVGGDYEKILYQFQSLYPVLLLGKFELYINSYTTRYYNPEVIKNTINEVKKITVNTRKAIGNDVEDSLLGINHIFSNFNYILNSPQLEPLKEIYSGFPAVCVASGPSLDKNIHVLKEIQNQVLVFCADSVYEKLLSNGILPDVISVMERPKVIYTKFFKGKKEKIDKRICLLSQGVAYPKVFEEYPGEKIVCGKTIEFDTHLNKKVPTYNILNCGSSCAHVSFGAAKYLGCNPIILVGQDLAYGEDGFSHAKGTYGEKRTETDDVAQEKYYVDSIDRTKKVRTTEIWDMFRHWFENEVKNDKNTLYINATEGGAYIKGFEVKTLSETAKMHIDPLQTKIPFYKAVSMSGKKEAPLSQLKQNAYNYYKKELKKISEAKELFKKIQFDYNIVQRIIDKREINTKGKKAFDIIIKSISKIDKGIKICDTIKYIAQSVYIQLVQFTHENNHIDNEKEFIDFFEEMSMKVNQLLDIISITEKELLRGLKIIETGEVDSIDTWLKDEQFEE